MSDVPQVGALQVGQDLRFQQLSWRLHRVGWCLMLLLVVAALVGVFGSGPLSRSTIAEGRLTIEYSRFARLEAPTEITVRAAPTSGSTNTLRLFVDREYLKSLQIKQITPEPKLVKLAGDHLTFEWEVAEIGEGAEVTFRLEPSRFGRLQASFGLDAEEPLQITQFVYP